MVKHEMCAVRRECLTLFEKMETELYLKKYVHKVKARERIVLDDIVVKK